MTIRPSSPSPSRYGESLLALPTQTNFPKTRVGRGQLEKAITAVRTALYLEVARVKELSQLVVEGKPDHSAAPSQVAELQAALNELLTQQKAFDDAKITLIEVGDESYELLVRRDKL